MSAVDKLVKQRNLPGQRQCARCPHSGQWHERTHDGHIVIGGKCEYPGCRCGHDTFDEGYQARAA